MESRNNQPADVLSPNIRLKLLEKNSYVKVDVHIPLRRYFRSGHELIRMAVLYHEENKLENAYVLYFKYLILFLEEISTHPEYPKYSKDDKQKVKQRCKDVFDLIDKIKRTLEKQYKEEYDIYLEEKAKFEENERLRKAKTEEEDYKLAKELQRIEEEKAGIFSGSSGLHPKSDDEFLHHSLGSDASYPGMHLHESTSEDSNLSYKSVITEKDEEVSCNLTLEPLQPSVPSRLLKPALGTAGGAPAIDRSSKPMSLLSGSSSQLRPVFVPEKLIHHFLALAAKNTTNNVETCGVLAGTMRQDVLYVTHLLIPEQSGNADSCTTRNEERLFEVQDQYNIITLGWIHTHPSQTAFLSSVDLHTHCSYQLMMPEAIAIVCAPKHDDTSIFTLTPDYGLPYIADCRETGFHPHPTHPPLFTVATHASLDAAADIQIIDLRP